ncbi:helix-turn-helix domain-containing protein [[Kitasatospora] papulosa]|uniref:helix-turn-helix transcriptional regulator n=1 Tax=Streptomyces TaxID=1883 RepID=UPI000BD2CF33|nr:hypothetical protein BCL80_1279 [Streptomyces avidinii]SNX81260.1 hypothetical protein SAMN05421860_1276 [Streptomyces microflavus]
MKRPMLTQREAAAACGVSRTTIRRRREAGGLPNSVQDEVRGWLIPVEDLLAAGFRLHAPAGPDSPGASGTTGGAGKWQDNGPHDVLALRAELERLRHEHALAVAEAEHGRKLAEAEAGHLRAQLALRVEQLASQGEHISDLQQTLRALMPAPERASLHAPVPRQGLHNPGSLLEGADVEDGGRRRWWPRP